MTRSIRLKPRLKEARETKTLSQAALGRAVAARNLKDFRPNHIGLFELGYRDATWAEVEVLANVLEVDPYWLANRAKPAPAVPIGAGLARAKEEGPAAGASTAEPASPPPAEAPTSASPAPATPPVRAVSAPVPAPNGAGPGPSRLPPGDLPVRNGSTETVYRAELGQLLTKANQTLMDRSLAPAEWRAWRDYAERIKTTLRTL